MEKYSIFFERLRKLMDLYHISSINEMALNHLGYKSSEKLNRLKKEGTSPSFDILNDISNKFEDISVEWLLTGKGDMLKTEKPRLKPHDKDSQITSTVADPAISRYTLHTDYFNTDRQQIPLYEIDAAAGLTTLFSSQNSQVPLDHISVPNAPKCDGAIFVRGDSMYPILKSGDIVCYKTIFNIENMIFGEMYLLDIDNGDDQYLTVKFVNKIEGKDDSVLLVSENKYHAPKEIPVSQIRALAIIKLSIRYNAIS